MLADKNEFDVIRKWSAKKGRSKESANNIEAFLKPSAYQMPNYNTLFNSRFHAGFVGMLPRLAYHAWFSFLVPGWGNTL